MSGTDRSGSHLGQYLLEEQVGAGAFGTVYRARHTHLGVLRAVKVLQGVIHRDLKPRNVLVRTAGSTAQLLGRAAWKHVGCIVPPRGMRCAALLPLLAAKQ